MPGVTRPRTTATTAKVKAKPSSSTRKAPAQTLADPSDELADQLADTLHIDPPPATRKTSTRTKQPESKAAAGPSRTVTKPSKPSPKLKPKPADDALEDPMEAYNVASQNLSAVLQSGWKSSLPPSSTKSVYTVAKVTALTVSCQTALRRVRTPKTGLDVERAALSVVGKLNALELFACASDVLKESKDALLALYAHDGDGGQHLHCLPLPHDSSTIDSSMATSLMMFQLNALTIQSKLTTESPPLTDKGNLLDWLQIYIPSVDAAKLTSVLNGAARAVSSINLTEPREMLQVRLWAMKCLAPSRALDPNTFWEQSTKCAKVFVKAVAGASDRESDLKTAKDVSAYFSDLIDFIRAIQMVPSETGAAIEDAKVLLFQGSGFTSMCEYWIRFAKYLSDIRTMNEISALLGADAGEDVAADVIVASEPQVARADVPKTSKKLSPAQLCAILDRTDAALQSGHSDSDWEGHVPDAMNALSQATAYIKGADWATARSEAIKVLRAVDTLGRTVEVILKQKSSDLAASLVEAVIKLGEDVISSAKSKLPVAAYTATALGELLDGTLDSLFLLAKLAAAQTQGSKAHPQAVGKAYSFLYRAYVVAQVGPAPSTSSSQTKSIPADVLALSDGDRLRYASTLRSISAAFHNMGATLLNGHKEAASLSFWKMAIDVGQEALLVYETVEGEHDAEPWTILRDTHMVSRRELVAYVFAKTGDRKRAYEAYVQALVHRPKALYTRIVAASRAQPVKAVFGNEPKLLQTLERITALATFDLFAFNSEGCGSLRRHLDAAAVPAEAIGAILEYQVSLLELDVHKEEAASAVKVLLKELKEVYGGDYPIRRARVLLRSMALAYTMNDAALNPSPVAVHGILSSKNLGMDTQLSGFIEQYLVTLEVLLSIQAHQHNELDGSTAAIVQHAGKAVKLLRNMLSAQPPQTDKKKTSAPTTKTARAPRKVAAASARTKTTVSKTPKKPSKVESLTAAVAAMSITQPVDVTLDDPDTFHRMLTSLAQLLGLLGHYSQKVEVLDSICQLCIAKAVPLAAIGYLQAASAIAHEYMKLGKIDSAMTVFIQASEYAESHSSDIGDDTRVVLLLKQAELCALTDDLDRSIALYGKALQLTEKLPSPDTTAPTSVRIRARVIALERSALASNVYAAIQLSRDNTTASLGGSMQALRLWNRAIENSSRLRHVASTSTAPAPANPNPFLVTPPAGESQPPTTEACMPSITERGYDNMLDGLYWRLTDGLLATLFALGRIHFLRGSVKASEYFIQKTNEMALSMNAPILLSRSLARQAELELTIGRLDSGHALISQATYSWEQVPDMVGPDLADLHRLQGDHNKRIEQDEEAKRVYAVARDLLERVEKGFSDMTSSLMVQTKETSRANEMPSTAVPALFASVLRQHIWLLRMEGPENPLYSDLLERFLGLPPILEAKVEENALMGKLAFEEVLARLEGDIFLSSLTESAIAVPMGMSSGEGVTLPNSNKDLLIALTNAEQYFWSCLELGSERGEVHGVREASIALTLLRAFQTSLGRGGKTGAYLAAALLDASAAITLRRELIECIDYKLRDPFFVENLTWPTMNPNGSPLPPSLPIARRMVFDDSDEETTTETDLRSYWEKVRQRYRSESFDAASLSTPQVDSLPAHWTVVNISVTDDKRTLFLSRQRPQEEPITFCLPLNRQSRREGEDDEEHFSYEKALEEFADIIRLNDETAKTAKDMADKEARVGWWAERSKLDTRLKELLENIEYCWLGAFKTILSEPVDASPEDLNNLRSKFDKVFRRNGIMSQERKSQLRVRLDDNILECFSHLSPKCRDEEIEDVIYFVLDLYQLHGAPVALSDIDMDQVGVDLRAALEEYSSRLKRRTTESTDHHLFLVLDKNVQGFPWESIPTLRGRSVSRIPSVSFLLDRVELAQHLKRPSISNASTDRTVVDPLKSFYVLNPSGDLKTTQTTYQESFRELERCGWQGITGRAPSEEEMLQALQLNDLMLYFGHGGAQNYVRSHKLRHLSRCAVTMLWGCSSGAMKDMGDFDRVGTPNHYMVAGCPTLVANLWDVTDREIDRVAQAVLSKLRLDNTRLTELKDGGQALDGQEVSVVQAVSDAREACKLKYLTGAAPVVYGIPFYL